MRIPVACHGAVLGADRIGARVAVTTPRRREEGADDHRDKWRKRGGWLAGGTEEGAAAHRGLGGGAEEEGTVGAELCIGRRGRRRDPKGMRAATHALLRLVLAGRGLRGKMRVKP